MIETFPVEGTLRNSFVNSTSVRILHKHRCAQIGSQRLVFRVHARVTSKERATTTSRNTLSSKRTISSSQKQTASSRTTSSRTISSKPNTTKKIDTYFNVTGFPFPLGPILERETVRVEVDPGRLWLFEQRQSLGFTSVSTNVRMTVIKLKSGGLWVHAPIAPTRGCVRLLNELGAPVEYIILPTFAYEHKIFVGPFSRRYPKAKVYVAPKQWSWPINLPPALFGIFPTAELKHNDKNTPWGDEIEQKILSSTVGIGPYVEVAFLDKVSKTLLVTDCVVYVPDKPPPVVPEAALLESGGPNFILQVLGQVTKEMEELPKTNPIKAMVVGWQRMALLVLFFRPDNASLKDPSSTFRAISNKLIVSPVIQKLVFTTGRDAAREWVNDISSSWNFKRLIACHYAAPVKATPKEFKRAFFFLYDDATKAEKKSPFSFFQPQKSVFPEADMRTLNGLEKILQGSGILYTKPKP